MKKSPPLKLVPNILSYYMNIIIQGAKHLYYSSSMIGSGYMHHNYCSSIRLVKELSVSQ